MSKASTGGTIGALLLNRAARGTHGGPHAEARPIRVSRDARAPLRKHELRTIGHLNVAFALCL